MGTSDEAEFTGTSITPMNGPRRLLVGSLLVLLVLLIVKAHIGTIWAMPRAGVDVEIPLRAAERWLAGGDPYDLTAFESTPGATQPFLYPPFVLPIFAVLTWLPRMLVLWTAVAVMLVAAIAAIRRLRVPWPWLPLVLAWPPVAEGIVDANLAVLMFLAFVVLFFRDSGRPWRPDPRDVSLPSESTVMVGGLATFIGAVKVSQPHAWLFVLHHRWRAALLGVAAMAVIVIATLPLTGIDLWVDWIAQLRRASEGGWDLGGFALPRFLPPGVGLVVSVACLVAVWFAPRRDPAPWVGILSTVGSLSLHIFGLLFLIPAMLRIRLEISLAAACFIATYSYAGAWAGILLVAGAYAAVTFGGERLASWVAAEPVRAPAEQVKVAP